MARLLDRYRQEIIPELKKQLNIINTLAVPKLDKVVINMGVGKATEQKDRIEAAVTDLGIIAGQRPVVTRARQSVAGFHIRKNDRLLFGKSGILGGISNQNCIFVGNYFINYCFG